MLNLTLRLVATLGLFALAGCPEPADDSSADKDVDTSTDTDDSAIDTDDSDTGGDTAPIDADNDGSPEGEDCDDADATRTPGRTERCDSVDNDCDDVVDNDPVDGDTFYGDADADGFGVDATTITACSAPVGYSNYSTDCDDNNATSYPGATEYCNGTDDNCNGATDENTSADAQIFYADNDGDTFGNPSSTAERCEAPAGYVTDASDCNDFDANQFPGATEYCNNEDDDCDGEEDEADAVDPSAWYADNDGDGFGDATIIEWTCNASSGFVEDNTDCDDGVVTTNPGAAEWCDGVNNDCDTETDESTAMDATMWYADADDDTYGDPTTQLVSCTAPLGYVEVAGDCEDGDRSVNPDAVETCDGIDNDCDTEVDGELSADAEMWYADIDNDTYGDSGSPQMDCEMPVGFVANATDCDDDDDDVSPVATEVCDGIDNNCDNETDDPSATDTTNWYADVDNDGFGDADIVVITCDAPDQYVADATDCDDAVAASNPGETEVCDGIDNNCDTSVDEGATLTAYTDGDGDGFGNDATAVETCATTGDQVLDGGDCLDTDADVYPTATESCDGIDNDCDTTVDEGVTVRAYTDSDADGYGDNATAVVTCATTGDQVLDGGDCADDDWGVFPGAPELCDGQQNDCEVDWLETDEDGLVSYWAADTVGTDVTAEFTGAYSLLSGDYSLCYGDYDVALSADSVTATLKAQVAGSVQFTAANAQPILTASGSTLDLSGITFADGSATRGAAIYLQSSSAEATDCVFSNNTASSQGGAIYADSASSVMVTSSAFGGSSSSFGAAIFAQGTLNVYDSTFASGQGTFGGAIYHGGSGSTLVDGCTFDHNSASSAGGAIALSTGSSEVIDSTFSGNTATTQGGAIWAGQSENAITGSSFADNSAGQGGAIDAANAAVQVADSEFLRNTATNTTTWAGGALYLGAGIGSIAAENLTFGIAADANSPADVGLGATGTGYDWASPATFSCTILACN